MKISINLENLSLAQLAVVYNIFSSSKVKRFSGKEAGLRRTNKAINNFVEASSLERAVEFYEESEGDLPAIFEFESVEEKPAKQPKIKAADRPVDLKEYNKINSGAGEFTLDSGEKIEDKNFCSLIAVALLTQEHYHTVFEAFREAGRKTGRGVNQPLLERALAILGWKLKEFKFHDASAYPGCHGVLLKNVTSFHPKRFPDFFKEIPNLYCTSSKHAFAIIDGQTKDWSHEKYLRIRSSFEIVPMTEAELKAQAAS